MRFGAFIPVYTAPMCVSMYWKVVSLFIRVELHLPRSYNSYSINFDTILKIVGRHSNDISNYLELTLLIALKFLSFLFGLMWLMVFSRLTSIDGDKAIDYHRPTFSIIY
jgi:hypothetical protein